MKKISDIEEIGQLLRQKREEQGLNQKEFAEAAGVGNRIVSEVERGKPTAQIDKVLKLLKYAGLTVYIGDE
ncbi:MAG TPA: transcriptional regulator [Bacteroidales bacterium]|nr:transcriptional regulator [Bacteroidales bacterium]